MSVGVGLLKKLVEDGHDIGWLNEQGLSRSHLYGDEVKVYDYIAEHFSEHGEVPSIATIRTHTDVDEVGNSFEGNLSYCIEQVKKRFLQNHMKEGIEEIQDLISEGEVGQAYSRLSSLQVSTGVFDTDDGKVHELKDMGLPLIEDHNLRQKGLARTGVSFGIPYLDEVSDGAQPGDTVAVVGRPATGKSYLIFGMALGGYLDENRKDTPMILTMEMTPKQVARRILSLYSHVSAAAFRLGKLTFYARKKLVDSIEALKEVYGNRPFYIIEGSLNSTVEDLPIKIQEKKPSVLYIDGAYLLKTRGKQLQRWERVAETAEYIKSMAKHFNIPIISTYQFNRRGAKGGLANIGYSDAPGQLASIAIGIRNEDDKGWTDPVQTKLIDLLKGREGEEGIVKVRFDMQRMNIDQIGVVQGSALSENYEELHTCAVDEETEWD